MLNAAKYIYLSTSSSIKWKNGFIHPLAWAIYFAYDIITSWMYEGNLDPHFILINCLFVLLTFYGFSEVFYPLIHQKKWSRAILYLFAFTMLYLYLKSALSPNDKIGPIKFMISESWRILYFALLAYGFWFFRKSVATDKEKRLTEIKLLKAELAQIKKQMSPHFLLNVLAQIHRDIDQNRAISKKTIRILSDLTRYSLVSQVTDSTWFEELKYLQKYIKLQKSRFGTAMHVVFENNIPADIAKKSKFPSMVLITLTENVFKHGVIHLADFPARIRCDYVHHEKNKYRLEFMLINKIHEFYQNKESWGLGLTNSQEIIHRTFGSNAKWSKSIHDNTFYLKIQITYEYKI